MDWSEIRPLTEHEALLIVSEYLSNHGHSVQRIETKNLPEGKKAPDFMVLQDLQPKFLCEVKTPAHNPNEKTRMYHWDTTFNKIRGLLHKASKQFNDYDPKHLLPRVVIFTSNHPQLNWTNFQHNILGKVQFKDLVIRDYRNKPFVIDTNEDIRSTDPYVWMQINYLDRKRIAEMAIYPNEESNLFSQIQKIVSDINPTAEEEIHKPRYSSL